jgi:hypothetical protein
VAISLVPENDLAFVDYTDLLCASRDQGRANHSLRSAEIPFKLPFCGTYLSEPNSSTYRRFCSRVNIVIK